MLKYPAVHHVQVTASILGLIKVLSLINILSFINVLRTFRDLQ